MKKKKDECLRHNYIYYIFKNEIKTIIEIWQMKEKKRHHERIDWWGRRSTCRKAIAKFACMIANYI